MGINAVAAGLLPNAVVYFRNANKSLKSMTAAERRLYHLELGVPAHEIGPSGYPKIHNVDLPSKNAAKDAALEAGVGKPIQHPGHYHSTDASGGKIPGTHFNYPD